jgi:hypothetical protein
MLIASLIGEADLTLKDVRLRVPRLHVPQLRHRDRETATSHLRTQQPGLHPLDARGASAKPTALRPLRLNVLISALGGKPAFRNS